MFATFEGPEGAGKSTAIRAVSASLETQGFETLVTREPGDGPFGARVRSLLLEGDGMPPESELFLFLADRANHVQTIVRPAIRAGKVVLCDRFADSTLVYQCRARELDEEFVRSANLFATGELTPDVTFLLDLPVEVGLARVTDLNRLDKEPVNFHEKVRQGFLAEAAAEPGRWVVIDAQQAAEDVANRIIGELLARLG